MNERENMLARIRELKEEQNAVVLAHTYQPGEVQDCADFVGDSYGLSVEAVATDAAVIIFAGVMFMAETAAILNPHKKVILPEPNAGCPMADMITAAELSALKAENADCLVMCYVNSTAEIKALSDVCCTSSNAVKIAAQIPADTKIIFVPDRNLGSFVQEQTGRDMILWDGCCPTHVGIRPALLAIARKEHPDAQILIHPEAPKASRDLADQILSTGGMCSYVAQSEQREFVIATEEGLLHTLRTRNPDKLFYSVSPSIVCPNMKKGSLEGILRALEGTGGMVVSVDEPVAFQAIRSLQAMLDMSKQLHFER